jgi:hypothetical protein
VNVAAWPRKARYETAADRIGNGRENDRDGVRLSQQGLRVGRGMRKKEIGLQRDEFLGEPLFRLRVAGCYPSGVDPDVALLGPPELLESLTEYGDEGLSFPVALGISHERADPPHPARLLRARRKRPGCGRAAGEIDEIAASHSDWPSFGLAFRRQVSRVK